MMSTTIGSEGVGVNAERHRGVGVAEATGDGAQGWPFKSRSQQARNYSIRRPEMAREMTMRWISLVPSKMLKITTSGISW